MSLLTDTQGTPERVWALIKLLQAAPTPMPVADVYHWLVPNPNGTSDNANYQPSAAQQAIDAARSLNLVQVIGGVLQTNCKTNDAPAFADLVHSILCAADPSDADTVILQVFAWFVIRCETEGGFQWIQAHNVPQLVDKIQYEIWPGEDRDRRFNKTKWAPWLNWIEFLGLGDDVPEVKFLPYLYARLKREVRQLHGEGNARAVPAERFVKEVARRMPYLDGGSIFNKVAGVVGYGNTGHLSTVLSDALRELHDEHVIRMSAPSDAVSPVMLAENRFHQLQFMVDVTILE